MGLRGPVGYAEHMGMQGAADSYLYQEEIITPPHVEIVSTTMDRCTTTDLTEDFASFYDFRQSLKMPKKVQVLDVTVIAMRNINIMSPRRGS